MRSEKQLFMNEAGRLSFDLEKDNDFSSIITVCDALASPVRLNIVKYLQSPPHIKTVPELVKELNIPKTTLMHHLKKLEDAAIIKTNYKSYSHGTVRIVTRHSKGIDLNVYYNEETAKQKTTSFYQSLGVGEYAFFSGERNFLHFATDTELFGRENYCYLPQRYKAQLLYSQSGRLSYFFENAEAKRHKVVGISFSLEICSEAPFFNNDYISDITFWINGREIATYVSEGDFGDRRGLLNPPWWPDVNTQYGKLVTISVTDQGVFLNGTRVPAKIKSSDLELSSDNKITFTFGNKDTAEHVGGFNVFGAGFGDYPQDIIMTLTCTD
ncbi:MAG: helix-turn-helix domain-containing protein [Clostridia bacterium]|nr:helix-turn-helix domain-containing protein [Clostridia bacterium]